MMRQPLRSAKITNGTESNLPPDATNDSSKPMAKGKMMRQIGRTNLHAPPQNTDAVFGMCSRVMPLATQGSTARRHENFSSFDVFEEPDEQNDENAEKNVVLEKVETSSSNNMIYDIEKLVEQKEEKVSKYLEIRAKPGHSRGLQLRAPAQSSFEQPGAAQEQDDDLYEATAVPQSGATSIRSELSKCHMVFGPENEEDEDFDSDEAENVDENTSQYGSALEGDFKDADSCSDYATALSNREQTQEAIFNCEEYFHEIYEYMSKRQSAVRPSSRYMSKQSELTVEMRSILVDWFCDVVSEYGLQQETLHLAVSIVDRVLSLFMVDKTRLQLVGTTALMIAAKYEEIFPPELKDFVHVTDDTYLPQHILSMEQYLLTQLDFVVSVPTVSWFGTVFAKRQGASRRTVRAMQYLMDLTLLRYSFLQYRPSYVAAACLCYANVLTGPEPWSAKMVEDTGIVLRGFSVILPELHRAFTVAPHSDESALYHRYSSVEMDSVATIPPPSRLPIESATLSPTTQAAHDKSLL